MSDKSKVFDEWNRVDCNECAHYWDDSCSGVPKDSQRQCGSYLATRTVVIPEQIKSLDKRLKYFGAAIIALALLNLILWGVYIYGN